MQENISAALVELSDGKPFSPVFNDIYATRSGAYGQACAVFLGSGEVPARWAGKERFCILENGFGLGTNFLTTLKAWREDPRRSRYLDYVSIERYPVSREDLLRFAAPEVAGLAGELAARWPDCLPGFHRLDFDEGRVQLTLIFHDSQQIASKLNLHYDALFLDGFAPSKNPQMWDPVLLRTLSRYAKTQATVTTWCTAGAVRASLTQSGFALEKRKGFGAKAERLFGVMHSPRTAMSSMKPRKAIVVGAGLAGANAAFELARQSVDVRVVDAGPVPGSAASALAWGILHPHYSRDDNLLSRFSREGFLASVRRLNGLQERMRRRLFADIGNLQLAQSDVIYEQWCKAKDRSEPFALPASYAELLDAGEASDRAGLSLARGGWYFPGAGMVRSGAFCRALLQASGVAYRGNTEVIALRREKELWQLIGSFGEVIDEADAVVLANAADSMRLLKSRLAGLETLPGRITLLRDTDLSALRMPVSGEGYAVHMDDGYCGVGATYELKRNGPWTIQKAHEANLAKLQSLMRDKAQVVVTGAYEGVRATGPGRLPYVGAVCDEKAWLARFNENSSRLDDDSGLNVPGLWLMAGFGSRGLSMTTRASEILSAQMLGLPVPADKALVQGIGHSRALKSALKALARQHRF